MAQDALAWGTWTVSDAKTADWQCQACISKNSVQIAIGPLSSQYTDVARVQLLQLPGYIWLVTGLDYSCMHPEEVGHGWTLLIKMAKVTLKKKKKNTHKMVDRAIKVAVLEGDFAATVTWGFRFH